MLLEAILHVICPKVTSDRPVIMATQCRHIRIGHDIARRLAAVGLQTGDYYPPFMFVQVLSQPIQETQGQWRDSL